LKKLTGKRTIRKVEKKEIIMFDIDYHTFIFNINELKDKCVDYITCNKRWIPYFTFWKQGGKDIQASFLSEQMEYLIEEGRNSDKNLVLNKLMDYPMIEGYLYNFRMNEKTGIIIGYIFPLSIFFYLFAIYRRKLLIRDIQTIHQTCEELLDIIRKF
jgi:lipopolysaccharide export system permease protein